MIAPLLSEHLADLQKSGLNDATIAAAQIQTVSPRDLQALGSRYQSAISAYRIPYFHIDGTLSDFHRLKLFPTVKDSNGHTVKYHQPAGTDAGLYRPPLMDWSLIATDHAQSLVITEGEKKTLALAQLPIPCLGIGGLWSWRAKVDGKRMTLPEFDTFRWETRRVELAPDSDVWGRPDLVKAVFALAMELVRRGAVVSVVKLPERAGEKVGLDDFLVSERAWPLAAWQGLERVSLEDPRLKWCHAWHQRWDRRQTFDDVGLVKQLADAILKTDHFANDEGGHLYWYEAGVYRPKGAAQIAQRVKQLLEANSNTRQWSTHRANEVAQYIAVDAPRLWEQPPAGVVNVKNGLLNMESRTRAAHSPNHLSSVQLPVTYDPAAQCLEWDAFVADVLPEDCHTLVGEIFAWLLVTDLQIQKALLLYGAGENGKSTFLAVLTAFLGAGNVSGLSLQRTEEDKFSTSRLLGKLANICPDLPPGQLSGSSVFKAIVGGDRLLAERKYEASFEFLPFVRLIFSANHFPQSKDSSYAFFRRWTVIPFDKTITPEQKRAKPDLLARLKAPQELSGILNRALDAFPLLRQRADFSQSESTTIAAREFQEQTDPLAVWLDRTTTMDPNGLVTKKDLFLRYSADTNAAGRPVIAPRSLYAAVKRLRPGLQETQRRVNGTPRDVFIGLTLTSDASDKAQGVSPVSCVSSSPYLSNREPYEERGEKKEKEIGKTADTPDTADTTKMPLGEPCFSCKGTAFWESIHGAMVCAGCHPPINDSLVKQWIGGGSGVAVGSSERT